MHVFVEWLRCGGIMGLGVLLPFPVLFVAGVALLCVARARKAFLIYLLFALLPLGVGLLGTGLGYAKVAEYANGIPNSDSEELKPLIEHGRSESRYSTYLGITVSAPLLLIGLIGLATRMKRPEIESRM